MEMPDRIGAAKARKIEASSAKTPKDVLAHPKLGVDLDCRYSICYNQSDMILHAHSYFQIGMCSNLLGSAASWGYLVDHTRYLEVAGGAYMSKLVQDPEFRGGAGGSG
jgi:hypothetical protein